MSSEPPLVVMWAAMIMLVVIQLSQPVVGIKWFQNAFGFGQFYGPRDPYQADYDAINELLASKLPTDDALENLLETVKWSKQLIGEQPVFGEDKARLQSINLKALVQFNSLLKLLDEENLECGLLSHDILRSNEKSTGTTIMVGTRGPLRRIETVIRQVAEFHASQCRYRYPRYLKWAQKDAPKMSLDDTRRMMNGMIETSQTRVFANIDRETDPRHLLKQKAQTISMAGRIEAQAMLSYLRDRARNDPDVRYLSRMGDPDRRGKWIVVEAKVHELLEKYAYSRCGYQTRAFGHILGPAEYEQRLSSRDNKYRAINNEIAEIIIQIEYHRLCIELLRDHKKTMEKNVIRAIWEEAN